MKNYKSELINKILGERGHEMSTLHYESECIETWINEEKGAYPKLTDYESEWMNYITQNPVGEFPYETITDVTDATVDNVVPYAYKSAILSGNTLVNLLQNNKIMYQATDNISDAYLETSCIYFPSNKGYVFNFTIKANKDYYVNFKDTVNIANIRLYRASGTYSNSDKILELTSSQKINVSEDCYLRVWSNGEGSVQELMMFEYQQGMENWDIPFFEGIQSVKMPVLTTTGKNLFDKTKALKDYAIYSNGNVVSVKGAGTTDYIKIEKGKTYSRNVDGFVAFYDVDKKFIKRSGSSVNKFTAENDGYIRWNFADYDKVLNTMQIEESSITSTYEPYKSNILTVNEDLELRGIGDEHDELDCLTGEVTERIREVVLDGSESWVIHTVKTNTIVYKLTVNNIKKIDHHIISDRFPTNASGDVEKITNTGTLIYVAILKSKADNVEKFKSYLSQNPMTVQYQLITESIKTVELTVVNQDGEPLSKIKPIEGTMHISTDGTPLKPTVTMEIPVEAITQNLNSFIEE